MKRALCIGHVNDNDPGYVGLALEQRGFELVRWNREDTALPAVRDYDVIVPLGSAWSSWNPKNDEQAACIEREQQLLTEAMRADVPMLAICFGMQQLSIAMGGAAHASPEPEIGLVNVPSQVTDQFALGGEWPVFHFDSVTPPPGSQALVENSVCALSFTLGRALAVQFHPETGPDIFARWLRDGGEALLAARGEDPGTPLAAVAANANQAERAQALVDSFLGWIETPSAS